MRETKNETRSPLKEKPLRLPGQSLDEEISRVFDEEVVVWLTIAGFGVYFAAIEWILWATAGRLHPFIMSFMALFVLLLAAVKVRKARKRVKALKLGRDGERTVSEHLDVLREKGFRILHDLVGDGFNVDHVIIGPQGIFTVETKTRSKPVGKDATVRLQNGVITIGGHIPDRDPIGQAKAQRNWVNSILMESTGKNYPVKPVIVYPGWFVEPMPKGESRDVWVLNSKAVPTFVENEPKVLSQQDVMMAVYQLSQHIRATN